MDRIDQTCKLELGVRDALHVPYVVARACGDTIHILPGMRVKFVDEKFTKFVPCDNYSEYHGIVNPFLEEVCFFDCVVVFLIPGITTPVRHHFDIVPGLRDLERLSLESDLDESKKEDPGCADCYEIRNNEVIRN